MNNDREIFNSIEIRINPLRTVQNKGPPKILKGFHKTINTPRKFHSLLKCTHLSRESPETLSQKDKVDVHLSVKGEDNSASFLISNKGLCVNVSYSELGDGQVMWTGDVLCTLKVILAQWFRRERPDPSFCIQEQIRGFLKKTILCSGQWDF